MTSLVRLAVICFVWAFTLQAATAARPNILLILADDLGYGDVHVLNPKSKLQTPNLDRLAHEGMVFTDAHAPASVCTPTRYALLTGRYCWRTSLKRGVLNGFSMPLIERNQPTLASFLREHGYRTGVVGKWHLGLGWSSEQEGQIDFSKQIEHGPNEVGFDESLIIPASLDMPPYLYVRNGRPTAYPTAEQPAIGFPQFIRKGLRAPDFDFEDCLNRLLREAILFIESATSNFPTRPFFLYVALTAPHTPIVPDSRFRGKSELGPYGDFVMQVDWVVGELLAALDRMGLRETTLVVFTSDNGSYMLQELGDGPDHVEDPHRQAYRPSHHTPNGPWRGGKHDIFEGGSRVPFLVRWPGVAPAGTFSSEPICLTDLFATVADILGKPVPAAAQDSFSFIRVLRGYDACVNRPPIILQSDRGMLAIRWKEWKLVLGNGSGGREVPVGRPFERPYQLFNLRADPRERDNTIGEHGEVAQLLEKAALAIINGRYPARSELP